MMNYHGLIKRLCETMRMKSDKGKDTRTKRDKGKDTEPGENERSIASDVCINQR